MPLALESERGGVAAMLGTRRAVNLRRKLPGINRDKNVSRETSRDRQGIGGAGVSQGQSPNWGGGQLGGDAIVSRETFPGREESTKPKSPSGRRASWRRRRGSAWTEAKLFHVKHCCAVRPTDSSGGCLRRRSSTLCWVHYAGGAGPGEQA